MHCFRVVPIALTEKFFPKVVVHKGEVCKKAHRTTLSKMWISTLGWRSVGAESAHARVYSDHLTVELGF